MGAPIDRSAKTAMDANLINGTTSNGPLLKNSDNVIYDYVDGLNSAQDAHANNATLAHPDGSVKTAKIADGAVTTAKLADLSVTTAKIANAAVGVAQLSPGAQVNESVNNALIVALKADNASQQRQINLYGDLTMPGDFVPTLPCTFTRDFDGKIKHNMNFNSYKNASTYLYVDLVSGNDSTGTGLVGAPYKTIPKAMAVALAGSATKYQIRVVSNTVFYRDEGWLSTGETITNKTISIVPDNPLNKIVITTGQRALSWTADGTAWKATRSGVYAVYDLKYKDYLGNYIPYTTKTTLADCQATPMSWYSDATYVWVNTQTGLIPTNDEIIVGLNFSNIQVTLLGTAKLYIENMILLEARSSDGCSIRGDATGATVVGEFCANNCTFIGGNLLTVTDGIGNAFANQNLKNCYLFNCTAAYSMRDGFNHHYPNVPAIQARSCLVLEYNCISYNQGLQSNTTSNNAFTAHEGVSTLRIGAIGFNTKGPVCCDVNGCYSVLYDCGMKDAQGGIAAAYNFSIAGTVPGKVYMENCSGSGNVTHDLETDFNTSLLNFRGTRISGTGAITYLDY